MFSASRRVRREAFTLLTNTTFIAKKACTKKWLLSSTRERVIPALLNLVPMFKK